MAMTDLPEPKCTTCRGRGFIVGPRDDRTECAACNGTGIAAHQLLGRSLATARAAVAHQFKALKAQAQRTEQALRRMSYREDISKLERHEYRRKADAVLNGGPRLWDEIPNETIEGGE
jgi:DnaJ-class molecular chaperone